MINVDVLKNIIAAYKKYFPSHWKDEKYKWEAVKYFQDHWDINAADFQTMFETATEKTYNLLASSYFYPRRMILNFAQANPEITRAMFINLFDETKDLTSRVDQFQMDAENIRINYNDGTWKNHFQNTNAISTYLWLRYPDKYYIYKYSECLTVAKELQSDFLPKRNASVSCMIGGIKLYDEICEQLKKDEILISMLQSVITDTCYKDTALKTMTIDIGFFVSRFYLKKQESEGWFPVDYDPNFTVDDWTMLLSDKDVFTVRSLEIMKRMKDYGGIATCKQLSTKYGETFNFYNRGSSSLAKRIAEKTGCPVALGEDQKQKWWPILFLGKDADKTTEGSFIWKLRDELSEALEKIDLSDVALFVGETEKCSTTRGYWWLNANPKIWSFSNLAVGETQSYTLYNDNGNKRRIFQNFLNAKPGDMIICYESYPVKQVVAIAKVIEEKDSKCLCFQKIESLINAVDYSILKEYPELEKMEYFINPQGSLFKLTKGEYDFIMDMIRETNPLTTSSIQNQFYTRKNFLQEVYMPEEYYDILTTLLRRKRNLILQGAPGVGKTYAAKRLAYAMMGEKNVSHIRFIQFHQNYSYEDFIMGYRPYEDGFRLTNGVFYQFCLKAANYPEEEFFFIIDEINRGNMSKIFGELLVLIESDYRGTNAILPYSGTSFSVPPNLYLIGMMNTADRSLAMIDYALRRRFSFFEMEPGFNTKGFKEYQEMFDNETFNSLIDCVKRLNKDIAEDSSLGRGFCIGHSYFCGQRECTEEWMKAVVYYDIIPMLQEYWFDEPTKFQYWENKLNGVFND